VKVASISTGLCSGNDVGYLKVTLLKLIPLFNVYFYNGFGPFLTLGTRSITSNIKTPKVLASTIAYIFGNAAISPTNPVIKEIIV
jgi:hypothetical protein